MTPDTNLDPVVARFVQDVNAVPWFKNIGQPFPPDTNAEQFHRWEDWPGPEEPSIFELSERHQALYDELLGSAPERREELENVWECISQIVRRLAAAQVPYDVSKDAWNAPSTAVWQASWTACLMSWCLLLHRQIPADLQEQWRWFVLGHWPSGYTVVWADERLGPLLVF